MHDAPLVSVHDERAVRVAVQLEVLCRRWFVGQLARTLEEWRDVDPSAFQREAPCVNARRIKQIAYEAVHAPDRSVHHREQPRAALRLECVVEEKRHARRDPVQWIPQVVRDDCQHIVAQVDRRLLHAERMSETSAFFRQCPLRACEFRICRGEFLVKHLEAQVARVF